MEEKKLKYAFRITHIDNIRNILQYGLVHEFSPNKDSNFVSIGDASIISKRKSPVVDKNIVLSDYIPFYLGPRSPMLYVIQKVIMV